MLLQAVPRRYIKLGTCFDGCNASSVVQALPSVNDRTAWRLFKGISAYIPQIYIVIDVEVGQQAPPPVDVAQAVESAATADGARDSG